MMTLINFTGCRTSCSRYNGRSKSGVDSGCFGGTADESLGYGLQRRLDYDRTGFDVGNCFLYFL